MKNNKTKILILMFISLFIGYLPWYNYSAVMSYISAEFGFTAAQEGLIVSAFQLGYVVVVLFTGWLSDKIGAKKLVGASTLCTAVFATLFVVVARDFKTTLIMRLLTGLSAGAIYAPGMSLLSNWFKPGERGKAMGAYTAGLVSAYAGGYFIASPLAASYGWRVGMLATSLPVFIAAIIVFAFVQEAPAGDDLYALDDIAAVKTSPEKFSAAGPVLLTISYMGHMWELYAFWGYIGAYMTASCVNNGLSASMGGLLAAIIILCGAPAVYLMGLLADRWGRTKTIIVTSIASIIPEFFFGYLFGKPVFLSVIVGIWMGFWVISDSAIYKAGLTDMVPENIRGTVLGIQSAVGFSMTVLAPIAFGKLLGALNGNVPSAQSIIWGPCFVMLGIGGLLAPLFALLTRKTKSSTLMAGGKK